MSLEEDFDLGQLSPQYMQQSMKAIKNFAGAGNWQAKAIIDL